MPSAVWILGPSPGPRPAVGDGAEPVDRARLELDVRVHDQHPFLVASADAEVRRAAVPPVAAASR